jgi:adenosylmethionine-8-amino-7-oxononanoate aminotransferase
MNAPARAAVLFGAGTLPKVAWGKGSYVYDTAGKRYIDGSSGPAAYCLGHGNAEVNAAIAAQLDKIAHGYRYTFTSDPLEELTEIVRRQAGDGLERMVFVTGGSEATESCLKIALQYHAARGDMTRRRFIARERSWHGNTLGALSVSGFLERRLPFEGALLEVSHLSPVNAYRPPPNRRAEDVARACAAELEEEILRLGPEKVAAFIFEPVVGAAGGAVPAPPGYARAVREICDRLVERVRDNGPKLMQMIRDALHGLDAVGDVRGRGYFIGVEFVADRATKQPFPAELQLFARIRQTAFDDGLICYPVGGNVDGVNGDIVIIAPPYNATDDELAEIADKFGHAARKALAAIGRG